MKKHPALAAHVCHLNDGKQSCKCFIDGWTAAQDEQIEIMKEHETIYEQWQKKTEEYDTKIVDLEIAKEAAIRNLKTIKNQIERGVDEKDILAQIAYAKDEIITPFSTYL